jgi:zinc protease
MESRAMARLLGRPALQAAIALLSSALMVSAAFAAEERVGDRLFLVRDKPGTPTQFQMIVYAGCLDEADGKCRGLAHYLEHLVLIGRNPEHKDAAVRFFTDGYANGTTSQRATIYIHSAPAREDGPKADLERLFGFYAARLKDFAITAEDAVRERNVVLQEHDWRVAGRPFPRFARMLDRALLPDHPAGQWTIGTKEDIDAFTLDDARAFHSNWYALNNATFVIRGDIEPVALKDIAARALTGLTARRLPPRARLQEPPVVVERKDFRAEDSQIRRAGLYVKKLFRMEEPDLATNRAARQIVLSYLQSRLPGSPYDVIVDRAKLAAGQPLVALTRVAPKTFALTVGADVTSETEPDKLLAAIESYFEALATNGISAQTITRLQTRFAEARANADKDPALVYSRLVAWLAQGGRYEDMAAWPQRVAAVSPGDVAAVLQGLSGPGRVVTGILTAPKTEPKP